MTAARVDGLRRAAVIVLTLRDEMDARITAQPGAAANKERRAQSRAYQRAANRIMDEMQRATRIAAARPVDGGEAA
ncbi:MAG TPA: hypothetical protein VHL34_24965 [Rhizomicrobium sp.]|jgi:hypothetical protein|nr:hypothetical protein [Rhizomicrobium sp.]